jgi:peptidoglycan/LPS O-acetylase OafA/YrhL
MNGIRHHYVPAFDGLRALAILPVIGLHVAVASLPAHGLRNELMRGWYGVDLFFVLSGFLITWLLIEEMETTGTLSLSRFYSRRFLRLGPAYISTLLMIVVGAAILHPEALRKIPLVAPALLTYTYNYELALKGPHVDLIVVVWSLCVEEQFYLLWPWLFRRLGSDRAFYFCAGAIVVLALYRSGLYLWLNWGHLAAPSPASQIRIYFSTDTRIDVIMAGCLAALSLRHHTTRGLWKRLGRWRLFPYAAAALALACVAWCTGGSSSSASLRSATLGYTISALAVAGMIVALFTRPDSLLARTLSRPSLVTLGKTSYGMYLFHLAIAWGVFHLLTPGVWSHIASRMSDPGLLGSALPVSEATLVPVCNTLSDASSLLANDSTLKFAIAITAIALLAFVLAWLHFELVERRFMAMRPRVAFRAALPGRET